jgi:hypothetical protein
VQTGEIFPGMNFFSGLTIPSTPCGKTLIVCGKRTEKCHLRNDNFCRPDAWRKFGTLTGMS